MTASRTIPESLRAATLTRLAEKSPAGRPYTTREVASWLLNEHGVTCSHMAVVRLHAAASEKGDALLVEALRETLRDAVAPVLTRMKRASKRVDELVVTEKNLQKAAAALSSQARALAQVATLGGVAAAVKVDVTSNGQSIDDLHARLGASLARLLKEPEAGGSSPVDPEPPKG